ncbi:hypothetical protein PHJA_000889200 [Phtheirospermum japonicum]|uniref:Uncharacterized protein n=1 Tax=Phtheirospermum japonicum TaxID=374723 RepID=A0A830BV45_9LAMI|nr:hypothetical protein PHJA_000889200 [Phtheirospermum japonicum]
MGKATMIIASLSLQIPPKPPTLHLSPFPLRPPLRRVHPPLPIPRLVVLPIPVCPRPSQVPLPRRRLPPVLRAIRRPQPQTLPNPPLLPLRPALHPLLPPPLQSLRHPRPFPSFHSVPPGYHAQPAPRHAVLQLAGRTIGQRHLLLSAHRVFRRFGRFRPLVPENASLAIGHRSDSVLYRRGECVYYM